MKKNPDSYITQTQLSNIIDMNATIHRSLNEELQEPINMMNDIDINEDNKTSQEIDTSRLALPKNFESKMFKQTINAVTSIPSVETSFAKSYNDDWILLKLIKEKIN